MTLDATCPISKQTDFKKCAVKISKVATALFAAVLAGRRSSRARRPLHLRRRKCRSPASRTRPSASRSRAVTGVPAPKSYEYATKDPGDGKVLPRPFDAAPPLIPHTVDGILPITAADNACLTCHAIDKPEPGGPVPIPASHYVDWRNAPAVKRPRSRAAGTSARPATCPRPTRSRSSRTRSSPDPSRPGRSRPAVRCLRREPGVIALLCLLCRPSSLSGRWRHLFLPALLRASSGPLAARLARWLKAHARFGPVVRASRPLARVSASDPRLRDRDALVVYAAAHAFVEVASALKEKSPAVQAVDAGVYAWFAAAEDPRGRRFCSRP